MANCNCFVAVLSHLISPFVTNADNLFLLQFYNPRKQPDRVYVSQTVAINAQLKNISLTLKTCMFILANLLKRY